MGNHYRYADVIVDVAPEKLDKPFTYRIPAELEGVLSAGTPVMVPFGNQKKPKKAYVTGFRDTPDFDESRLKDILSVAERGIGADDEFIELAAWMKERYACTMNKALKTVLPVRQIVKPRGNADAPVTANRKAYTLHELNEEQAAVFSRFTEEYDRGERKCYLLFGVTGSGKTDLYIHMIRHAADQGRKCILLIPEISLTYQTIDRLYAAFGERIAVIHSRLSQGERSAQIRKCMNGEADVIIGPRSAVFAPFSDIGLIVIDEEHDGAYKNETVPRYSTADVAIKRAQMHGASVLLCSATPSPESYLRAQNGAYTLLTLTKRAAAGAALPEIRVVDMREELKRGNRSIFSEELDRLIRDRLSRKEQIILFMNRRGYSSFISCRSCGSAVKCPHCDVSLTLHRGRRLICHYCGYSIAEPDRCPSCGSPYIAEFGAGTQKLETFAKKMYPEARIERLDTDSASGKNSSAGILSRMAAGETDILIGTQMVVKGHDFPNVTLVGIMAADTSLFVSEYTGGQRTYELISQAAGRAGRAGKPGTVILQTYKPEHYAVRAGAAQCYEDYFSNEMSFRRLLDYPPAVHVWTIQISCADEDILTRFSEAAKEITAGTAAEYGASVIGPAEASLYKVHDLFRKLIYVKHPDYDILLSVKDEAEEAFQKLKYRDEISLMYDFT